MKKLLTVLIALSMVAGGFAAEPLANVNTVDFSGEASVTWGYDLETKKAGFKNEADVELIINLLPGDMSKSTTGSGVWGELVLLVDGDTNLKSEDNDTALVDDFANVKVDTAKIHVNNIYFGITSGDFTYGGDFYYPNVINYANEDEDETGFIRDENKTFAGYDQGLVAGYEADMFSIEASVRTKPNGASYSTADIEGVDSYGPYSEERKVADKGTGYEYYDAAGNQYTANSDGDIVIPAGLKMYEVKYDKDEGYWSNNFAAGLYAEVKPIQDLRIGAGIATAFEGDAKKDLTAFVGADYAVMLDDVMSVVPAVTYNHFSDYDKGTEKSTTTESRIGVGVAYRWGASEDTSSLLEDFYGTKLVYNDVDEGDDDLLPGVSVFTAFDIADVSANVKAVSDAYDLGVKKNMDYNLPIMVNYYSGDIAAVPGLKAYGLFHMNVASKASELGFATANIDDSLSQDVQAALDNGVQVALAASYDIAMDDITITPSAGALYRYAKLEGKDIADNLLADADIEITYGEILPVVRVDVAGLVSNTTFTAEWSGAYYGKANVDVSFAGMSSSTSEKAENDGEFTLKAKIAL